MKIFVLAIALCSLLAVASPRLDAPDLLVQPGLTYPPTRSSYGAGDTIEAAVYDRIALRAGDSIYLSFPALQGIQVENLPELVLVTVQANIAKIKLKTPCPSGAVLNIEFSSPDYDFTIDVRDVWLGDANADGNRNMHDLLPIVLGIRDGVQSPISSPLSYPPDTLEMNSLRMVQDWGSHFMLGSRNIDFKHADCNLDGMINELDAEYLMAVLEPVTPPHFLVDAVNSIELAASLDASSIQPVILSSGQMGLEVAFSIEVLNADPTFYNDVLGVLFTRPLTETNDYRVEEIRFIQGSNDIFQAGFSGSKSDTIPYRPLVKQRFWNLLDIVHSDASCANGVVDHPLDVGVFKQGGILDPVNSGRIGNCMVSLGDVLFMIQGQNPTIYLHQHIINGVVYIKSNEGLEAHAIECAADSVAIDLSSFCNGQNVVMRDGPNDNGGSDQVPDSNAWDTPEIWLSSPNPMPGDTVTVYVRAFNQGCTVAKTQIPIYWTPTTTALKWPDDFGFGSPASIAGVAELLSIEPWDSAVGAFQWVVPPKSGAIAGGRPLFTFLADATNSGPTFMPPGPIRNQVLQSKQIAVRSAFTLCDSFGALDTAVVELKNPLTDTAIVSLWLTQIGGPDGLPASNFGHLEIFNLATLDPCPVSTHMTNVGTDPTGAYRLDANQTAGTLEGIRLDTLPVPIGIRFTPSKSNTGGPIHYRYKLTMVEGGTIYNSAIFEIVVPQAG